MRDEDKNTTFFHQCASDRKKRNKISKIQNSLGAWINVEDEIVRVFQNYFNDIFTSRTDLDLDKAIDTIGPKITDVVSIR